MRRIKPISNILFLARLPLLWSLTQVTWQQELEVSRPGLLSGDRPRQEGSLPGPGSLASSIQWLPLQGGGGLNMERVTWNLASVAVKTSPGEFCTWACIVCVTFNLVFLSLLVIFQGIFSGLEQQISIILKINCREWEWGGREIGGTSCTNFQFQDK